MPELLEDLRRAAAVLAALVERPGHRAEPAADARDEGLDEERSVRPLEDVVAPPEPLVDRRRAPERGHGDRPQGAQQLARVARRPSVRDGLLRGVDRPVVATGAEQRPVDEEPAAGEPALVALTLEDRDRALRGGLQVGHEKRRACLGVGAQDAELRTELEASEAHRARRPREFRRTRPARVPAARRLRAPSRTRCGEGGSPRPLPTRVTRRARAGAPQSGRRRDRARAHRRLRAAGPPGARGRRSRGRGGRARSGSARPRRGGSRRARAAIPRARGAWRAARGAPRAAPSVCPRRRRP